MAEAFGQVSAPIQFFAFTSDWLYPPYQTEEMATCLQAQGKTAEYHLNPLGLRPRCLPDWNTRPLPRWYAHYLDRAAGG